MADTETIRKDESLSRVERDQAPDKAVSLALEAVDEAYQERVKELFDGVCKGADLTMAGLPSAMDKFDDEMHIAKSVRTAMRKRITTGA